MAKTDDLLFIETENSCACCGMRDSRALTIHHIEQSSPKDENYDNKIVLCHNCHTCHHAGKGPTKEELQEIKRRLIVKSLTLVGLNALKEANRRPYVLAMPFLVSHLVERGLLKFVEMESGMNEGDPEEEKWIVYTASYELTQAGKDWLKKWSLR